MRKTFIFLLSISALNFVFGQKNNELQKKFSTERVENEKKLEKYLNQNKGKFTNEQIKEMQAKIAGFAGNIPVFLESDDARANKSANITTLQNGNLTSLNGISINGSSQKIMVMDGGRVFEKHIEFGADNNGNVNSPRIFNQENDPSVYYSTHATSVAGIIGAMGKTNFGNPYGQSGAKGVLSEISIDSYTFATTNQGTNYQKLETYGNNISNHSYGINLGWTYASSTSSTYPQIGFYWIGNYDLNTRDTYNGSYYTQDANFDKIIYSNPYQIVVKSAGNYYGIHPNNDATKAKFKYDNNTKTYIPFAANDIIPDPNCSLGFNCIGWGSLAKNIIVVGATDQLTTVDFQYTNKDDVIKSNYSSAGPRKDGAIKPDISAVGTRMAVAKYTTDTVYNDYEIGSGTSYSAPIISGIAGALTEVSRVINNDSRFMFKADEIKALLTHTANEAGNPGPDVWYGWGFADATKAAQLVIDKKNKKVYFERNSLTSGVKFTKTITAKTGEPLKATISWIDPAAVPFTTDNDLQNNTSSRLVNDLDLRIIDTTTNTIYYPWKLNVASPMDNATKGDNTVDNVEQILLETPIAGRAYRIEVSNKGTLNNGATPVPATVPQDYALIITGVEESSLGTAEISAEKLVTIYPTKTKDFVNVLIPKGAKTIDIFDLSGKSVLKTEAKSFQTIDVSQLPKGTYIINVKTDKSVSSHKFIKE
ncbi:S8 family peptidase [Cloacibacterium sp. Arc13]|uniref:S8 family peptidase n=1 Tax=unclassified Cloacibacterium TaxID=2620870 RepID=UPI00352E313F